MNNEIDTELRGLLEPINTKMIRLLADWVDVKYPNDENPQVQEDLRKWADKLDQALSLLKPPCEKTFNCKHFRGYSQPVPIPFGVGNCSEPLGDCAIESESEDCCLECPDYKESACQVPAGEIEEFVKTVRHKLLDVALYCGGLPEMTQVFQDLKQACDHLTALLKRCEQLEKKICNDVKCPNRQKGE